MSVARAVSFSADGTVLRPGIMEDLLWCLLNPAYGLARLHETFDALQVVPWGVTLACLFLSIALVISFARRH